MNVDPPITRAAPSSSMATMNIMMEEKNMKLRGNEKEKYKKLKDRPFVLTRVYEPRLMRE
jgi:hypothetical protein